MRASAASFGAVKGVSSDVEVERLFRNTLFALCRQQACAYNCIDFVAEPAATRGGQAGCQQQPTSLGWQQVAGCSSEYARMILVESHTMHIAMADNIPLYTLHSVLAC
jgi:hypothetical protein